jgi:hypothetical protein
MRKKSIGIVFDSEEFPDFKSSPTVDFSDFRGEEKRKPSGLKRGVGDCSSRLILPSDTLPVSS